MTTIDSIGSDNLGNGVLAELAGAEFDAWVNQLPQEWLAYEPNLDDYEYQQLSYENAVY